LILKLRECNINFVLLISRLWLK